MNLFQVVASLLNVTTDICGGRVGAPHASNSSGTVNMLSIAWAVMSNGVMSAIL